MTNTWLCLAPPLVVLTLGFSTRRVIFSLLCGIITAGLIAADFSLYKAAFLALNHLMYNNLDVEKLRSPETFWQAQNSLLCLFFFALSIIVTLVGHSGGAFAYVSRVKKQVKTKRGAQTSSLILSSLLFIDDYFSSLTVGSVISPITDQFRIPRVKLAFLVDSMAAPLAIIAPISSWVAAIIGFLSENGVAKYATKSTLIAIDPILIYARILPFIFYSFLIIAAAWFIVRRNISFGLMKHYEERCQRDGDVLCGKQGLAQPTVKTQTNQSLIDFALPIAALFCSVICGILYTGDAWIFGGKNTIIEAFQNANAHLALFLAGILALIITTLFFMLRGSITITNTPRLYWEGIMLMLPAVVILLLSWTLGDLLRENLKTGEFLAHHLASVVNVTVLPLLFFVTSLLISFSIGSSWSTAAIMFPIAIPMVLALLGLEAPVTHTDTISLLFPCLGAILSGGVAGDHISPISDTTVMSSTSTGSPHIDHVQTQLSYALPVIFATACSFLVAGFVQGVVLPLILGLAVCLLLLTLFNKRKKS